MAAGRYLFNRTVQARWKAHGLLEVRDCAEIPLEQIRWRNTSRKENDCFEFLPINMMLLGKKFEGFLDPITMLISNTSPIGPCSLHRNIFFRMGENFRSVDQTTGKAKFGHWTIKKWKKEQKLGLFPRLQPIIFHDVLHTPNDIFIGADHSEEAIRAQLIENMKVEVEKRAGNSHSGLPGIGEIKM